MCHGPSNNCRITMIKIGGVVVGLAAVSDIFKKLYELGKKPQGIDRKELVREVSIYNYIPSEAEKEYAEALIEEYIKYYKDGYKS